MVNPSLGDNPFQRIAAFQERLEQLQPEDQDSLREIAKELVDLVEILSRYPGENPNPVLRVDHTGAVVYANPAACDTLLAKRDCALGQPLPIHLREIARKAARSGQLARLDLPVAGRVFSLDIVPVKGAGCVNLYGREVTEQRAAEEALRRSEARFRGLVEQIPAVTFIVPCDDPSKPTYVSPQIEALAGFTPQEWIEIVGVWEGCLHPADRAWVLQELEQAIAEKTSFRAEYRILTRSGVEKWIEEQAQIVSDDAGRPACWQGILLDITDRKRDEALLERYRTLSEQVRDILLMVRLSDGRILEANRAAEFGYGYSRAELLALTIKDLRDPNTRDEVDAQLAQANEAGILFQTTHRRKEGSTFPVEVSSTGFDFGGERVLISVIRDMTERKQAEANLRESEERNRRLVELSPDAIFVETDGRFAFVNPAGLRLFGADRPEQLVGEAVLDRVHPVYRPMVARRIKQLARQKAALPPLEEQYLRLDGTPVDVEVMATPINYDNQPAVLVLARDITDRKRAEAALRESEAQARAHAAHIELQHYLMEQRERERVQIARDLHDGPMQRLAAINYELESVLRDSRVEEIRTGLRDVETALSREIADLRAYTNQLRPPVLTRFGLEAGIRSFAGSFQETHPDLALHLDIGPETSRLSQRVRLAFFRIFQEALYNVSEHSQASEITVRLSFVGKAVKLEVRDNGAGFALIPGELELARQGKLGLAGMREHAEAVGGTFHVQSWPGEGTIIRVTAPLEEEEAEPSGGKRRGRAET